MLINQKTIQNKNKGGFSRSAVATGSLAAMLSILSLAAFAPNAFSTEPYEGRSDSRAMNTSVRPVDEIARMSISDGNSDMESLPPGIGERASQEKSDLYAANETTMNDASSRALGRRSNTHRITIAPDAGSPDRSSQNREAPSVNSYEQPQVQQQQQQQPGTVELTTKNPVTSCARTDGTTCNGMDAQE